MKIFLVDDEPVSNIITRRIFRQINPDLEIFAYTDPAIAFRELKNANPQLIFLDINMPGLSGWDFLDKMIEDSMKYKVFMLSSSVSEYDQNKAAEYSNVIDLIQKPTPKEVLQRCLEILV